MDFKYVEVNKEEEIAVVKLNRPEKLNTLNLEGLRELLEVFTVLERDDTVKTVVLTGAGEKAFSAGADIKKMEKMSFQEARVFSILGHEVTKKIENLNKPVIAAINGYALGGGCELALACDLRVASENVRIGQPEINLGIIPGWGGTQRLSRLVGLSKAKMLIYTGKVLNAEEALEIGLVDLVVKKEELMSKVMELAKEITNKSSLILSFVKKALNEGFNMDLNRGCELETELFSLCFSTEDHKEGMEAFLEKRKPEFKGK